MREKGQLNGKTKSTEQNTGGGSMSLVVNIG